ncbi:8-oxo-dGTP diphosphatase [Halorarum halophilum]|uniref:Oxidized purine nucleoside triphosphate hydrolase n=1 Tax=Halorarum halophilum TaxID=2743090 RepID=A0A7D5GFL8_9EURY|nr:8-oxo-dGTP diphosphatase [Halobaculum halophilum]QLG26111.1 8-oxo-dGTP diphosphatase [Halobaculum halophilum]
MRDATLCHLVREARSASGEWAESANDETLLIHKKRGVGSDQYVGPGGKVEPGETPRECVVREVREEVGIEVRDPVKVGEFEYYSEDWNALVHVYRATEYAGDPVETDEAVPEWFPVDDLPLSEMWATDRDWLPTVLAGGTSRGRFVYHGGDPRLVEVETDVPIERTAGVDHATS